MQQVVILGAGFAGLELATRLSEQVADEVHVTIIDVNDSFVFGYSKLDVMFGREAPEAVRLYYRQINKPSVEFRQALIESIDPQTRRVITSSGVYEADILVVALGADVRPDETPGLLEGGAEFYSVGGAEQLRDFLPTFAGGKVVISVLGPFFKCPAAPFETAMMLHSYLGERGVLDRSSITLLSTLPRPIPVSPEASAGILAGLQERGIEFRPSTKVERIDPATKTAFVAGGGTLDYDLFLGIPVHRPPKVVVDSGLTEDDGWIAVDHTTFATRFPGVYAAGDITSAPVPARRRDRRGGGRDGRRLHHSSDQGRRRAAALFGGRTVLHRVRRAGSRAVQRQLPQWARAVRVLRGAIGGVGRVEAGVRPHPAQALVRPRLLARSSIPCGAVVVAPVGALDVPP